MYTSPVKRRVLGALDPNACSPKASPSKIKRDMKHAATSPVKAKAVGRRQTEPVASLGAASPLPASPRKPERDIDSRKRLSLTPLMGSLVEGNDRDERAPKRPRVESSREDARRQEPPAHTGTPPSSTSTIRSTATRGRSASPDTASLFDTAADNSQATVVTEPDTTAPAAAAAAPVVAPPPRRRLTREQAREVWLFLLFFSPFPLFSFQSPQVSLARSMNAKYDPHGEQKAEILRLRLGLASYKVRTGQTDVPLERLEARLGLQRSLTRSGPGSFPHGHGQTTTASVSTSFPPPSGHGQGPGRRRPLPGAPVRRPASIGAEPQHRNRDRAERHAGEGAGGSRSRVLGAEGNRRGRQFLQEEQRPHHRARQQEEDEEEEDDARLDDGRRPSVNGGLARPRSPAADARALSSPRSSLVEEDEEEEGLVGGGDDVRRGGAASGLLSLAKS
ncbi:uncharacterized protein B0T15DRAFT_286719 [Chaetomium strumarium]|uniref:Uncharacterized protein n=1 Tax=Chaetomium strumarium TaxID=1170767 RepID=A0AAJ0LY18_9PEZI|nr:hypothetical protein B0T15DRAFT_286719 [Chaetomium strumarium]